MTEAVLHVDGIHAHYGTAHVLRGVSLEVHAGEVVALLGRHGAGKTTTLKAIMGIVSPSGGTVRFGGQEIHDLPPHAIARLGIGYVPEDRRIFPDLTARVNLEVAARGSGYSFDQAYADFPALEAVQHRKGRHLSGGEQQMLTVVRTLMGSPTFLLLDEPTEGLAPVIVQALDELIRRIAARGTPLLLAEQNVAFALQLATRVYLLEVGEVRFSGTVAELRGQPALVERHLAVSLG
jgi:branched-chain amino acid transport system ATP-binding protein